jgi:hypothetical protein
MPTADMIAVTVPDDHVEGKRLGRFRRLLAMLATAVLAVAMVSFTPAAAHAASDYNGAVYQVEISLNCTNPTAPCRNVFGLGGVWGWIALMPGGTGNAQITECGHSGAGGGGAGAGHVSYDPQWSIVTSSPDPTTPVDPNGQYIFIDGGTSGPNFYVPATYGHYKVSFFGAFGQIQIAP